MHRKEDHIAQSKYALTSRIPQITQSYMTGNDPHSQRQGNISPHERPHITACREQGSHDEQEGKQAQSQEDRTAVRPAHDSAQERTDE